MDAPWEGAVTHTVFLSYTALGLPTDEVPPSWSLSAEPILQWTCHLWASQRMGLAALPSFRLCHSALAEWCLQHYLSSYLPGLVEGSCIKKCFAQGPSLIFTYWCCCLCKASLCIWQREQQLEKSWWRGGGGTKHPAFSPVLLHIVFWTSQIGLNVLIEKIVSTMQMRGGSESASHASNSYVDNLP